MATVTTNDGVELHYDVAGTGAPLVLVHGWNQTAALFERQVAGLSDRFRVITFDLRGHGESQWPDHGYRVSRYAMDLRTVIDEVAGPPAHVLGHSLGCCVLWSYFDLFAGEGIDRAVFVDMMTHPVANEAFSEQEVADYGSILSLLASFTDTAQAEAAADFAINQGWTTAVTFSVPGPYFGYIVEVFTETFESLGGDVLGDYPFVPAGTTDFSPQVNEIAALDPQPDVVYSGLLAFQAAILAAQLGEADVDAEMLVADAFTATGGYYVDGVEGFFHTSHTFPEPGGRMLRFLASYEAARGVPLESDSYSALAADAILVSADAVIRTGSLDPVTVGEAIIAGTAAVLAAREDLFEAFLGNGTSWSSSSSS